MVTTWVIVCLLSLHTVCTTDYFHFEMEQPTENIMKLRHVGSLDIPQWL